MFCFWLTLQPFGKVPAFEDGDLKLFGMNVFLNRHPWFENFTNKIWFFRVESRAITQYIAHRYEEEGTNLLPADSKNISHYAIMAIGMEVEAHHFDPVASKLAWEQVFKLFYGMTTDQAVVEEEEAKLATVLDVYEARLKEFKYLAGETFTLTDLHHIPVIQYLLGTPTKKLFDERPHVSEWVAEITNRPASQKILQWDKRKRKWFCFSHSNNMLKVNKWLPHCPISQCSVLSFCYVLCFLFSV